MVLILVRRGQLEDVVPFHHIAGPDSNAEREERRCVGLDAE